MANRDKEGTVSLQELVISSLATADALVKLLIEKGHLPRLVGSE